MPRARRTRTDPFTAWTRLAWRTGEMLLASAHVIAHRTSRIAVSGLAPHPADQAEFLLMGQEKVDAAIECAQSLARHATHHSWRDAARGWEEAWRVGMDLTLLAGSATPAQALHRHAQLVQRLAGSTGAHRATSSALALTDRMLAPLHRRTTANMRRLRGVRR